MKKPFGKSKKDIEMSENNNEKKSAYAFAKKVGDFFSAEPQREKVLSHEDFNGAGDDYFATVSANYKLAQRLLFLLLAVFLVISVVTNIKEITYDNFYYLIKDFTSAADAGNNTYETLPYESDSRQHFVLYRGGIATVSPSKLSIFTATGRRTLNEASSFSSPFAVSSSKYVLFYDTSGNNFSIYNSFARVYNEELPNPVKCASLSDDGSFAVVTKSTTGYWTTRIYTKSFDLKAIVPSSDYIFGIDLDSEREMLAVLSYNSGDGVGETKVSVYDLSQMKDSKGNKVVLKETLSYKGEFPIKCGFTSNNSFSVITNNCVRTYDKNFEPKDESDEYIGGDITGFSLNEYGTAVSVMRSSSSMLLAYDNAGNLLYDRNVSYNVLDISICGKYLFLQTDQGVIRINTSDSEEKFLASGRGKMLIYNEKTALVCGESKAEYLVF